jgi:hypothetical protein
MKVNGGILSDVLAAGHVRDTYNYYYQYCRKNLKHNATSDEFEIQITLRKDGSIELVKGF